MKEWLDDFLSALKDVSWATAATIPFFVVLTGFVYAIVALMKALGVL